MVATSWLAPESWRPRQEQAIRELVEPDLDWDRYLQLVERHRTPAIAWAALQCVKGIDIPEAVREKLQQRSRNARLQTARFSLLLAQALQALERAAIPVMPMKGPLLSLDLYGDLGLRQSHDIDLACKTADIERAYHVLEETGWQPDPIARAFVHDFTPRQKQEYLRYGYGHDLSFTHRSGAILELMWRDPGETTEATNRRWQASHTAVWNNCSYQVLADSDLIHYLCTHGQRHAWFRVKWLGDLARLHADGRIEWQACLGEAQDLGQRRMLLASLSTLVTLYGFSWPGIDMRLQPKLPTFLLRCNLRAMTAFNCSPNSLENWIELHRIDHYIKPHYSFKEWLLEYSFCGQDYMVLRLPDRYFWMYRLLRPFLFVWRRIALTAPIRPE
jgi:hypothetical protein